MSMGADEWVEVRSKEEILQTLDERGRLDKMPFTPQMFEYCGKRFRVRKSAHKTCDPIYTMAARKLVDTVHLDLRCDGKAYGGCSVGCLLFWKEAWLKSVAADTSADAAASKAQARKGRPCTDADVWKGTRVNGAPDGAMTQYTCQTTELPKFTTPLAWWNPAQYIEDYRSGNVTLGAMVRGAFYSVFVRYPTRLAPYRIPYNALMKLMGASSSPVAWGYLRVGRPQPNFALDLQPGELVRIKSHDEILKTLDRRNKNRGLYFDVEMVPFCGTVCRVRSRLDRFIDERTGRMKTLKTPAVILEGVACQSCFSKRRMYCPRALHSWWREVWVERVSSARADVGLKPAELVETAISKTPRTALLHTAGSGEPSRPLH